MWMYRSSVTPLKKSKKMKRFIRIATALAIATIMLSSCLKDTVVMYNYSSMGSLKGGVFTSDDGDIIEIVENQTNLDLAKDQSRIYVVMDILSRVEGTENKFTSSIKGWEIPTTKSGIDRSTAATELRTDPVSIHQAWLGGGYINALIIYPFKKDSKVEHDINLVIDRESAAKDTLFLSLSHDAKGEVFNIETNNEGFVLGSSYYSFVVDQIKTTRYKYLCFEWDWYETDDYGNPYPGHDRHYKQAIKLAE